jgi:hypothetical protein
VHPLVTFAIQIAVVIPAVGNSIALARAVARIGVRPRRLVATGDAFTVPANRRVRLHAIANPAAMTLLGIVALTTSDIRHRADTVQTAAFFTWWFIVVLGVAMTSFLAWAYRRPPMALTPSGVRLAMRTIPWPRLEASVPRSVPTPMPRRNASFPNLDADPAFVAAAIDHYRRNRAARAAIGQPGEYERLETALAAPESS